MVSNRPRIQMITGVDVGSTTIRVAIGQISSDGESRPKIQILGAIEVASEGVQKGIVTSIEDTVSSVSSALEQVERLTGMPIESAWIGMGGADIFPQASRGVVAVAKSDGEIAEEDVERAVEAARAVAPPLNYEMLHIVPRGFSVDGQTGIKDPVGMTGIRLEVDTQIIYGLSAHVKNYTKAVYRTGIDIDDLIISILATGDVVSTPRQQDLGVAVVNIGGSVTSLVVYEEGEIVHVITLPIGSSHVTNDLAIGLKTSIDIAERVKINYGNCLSGEIRKTEKIDLEKIGAEKSEDVSKRFIAEIVEARMTEIFEKIDQELETINLSGLLPAGIIFTGGGSKLEGLTDLAKEVLRLPTSLGYPIDIISSTDKINDLSFATAIGLVKWGAGLQPKGRKMGKKFAFSEKAIGGVKKLFKSLIP